jgi:hypothetical protein
MNHPGLLLLLPLLALTACRDELAGPRRAEEEASGVVVQDTAPGDLTFRSGGRWARGGPTYLGARVSPANPRPGERVTVTHVFRAGKPQAEGWAFFVHAVDPDSGAMLANLDHPFQEGRAPLSQWPAGKVIEDRHAFELPVSPSGRVELRLGFWKGDARLPIASRAKADGAGRMKGPRMGEGKATPPPPSYRVAFTATPPRIDGELGPTEWRDASKVTLRGSRDGAPVQRRTEARILWDETHLYVAFEVEDPDVWGTHRERDAKLYEEEVVEIFIDADADGRDYNELQLSPHNVLFDAAFTRPRQNMDLSWDSGTRSAVKVQGTLDRPGDTDRGWTAELAIPIARLKDLPRTPPRAGDRWRFNLYRLEHLERGRRVEGQSFAPLHANDFHRLDRFGWLVFEGGPAAAATAPEG